MGEDFNSQSAFSQNLSLRSRNGDRLQDVELADFLRTCIEVGKYLHRRNRTTIDAELFILTGKVRIRPIGFTQPHIGHFTELSRVEALSARSDFHTVHIEFTGLSAAVVGVSDMLEY